jgi:carbamoyltransferase
MTVAPEASARFRAQAPAAVHVDGTARPQVVHADEEPELHALLTRYVERSGSPALVNTSFNRHQEPIVESPRDAVRCFLASGLPVLRLGPFVLERPGTSWEADVPTNGHA